MINILTRDEKEKIENYRIKTYALYYIFSDNINELLRKNDKYPQELSVLYDPKFVDEIEKIVAENLDTHILNSNAKENIYIILFYIRTTDKLHGLETKIQNIDRFNGIIRNLNNGIYEENYYDFVISELNKRENKPSVFINDIYNYNPVVFKEAYAYDVKILEGLYSQEKQYQKFVADMLGDEYYFASIMKFTKDIPELFKDDEVYEKICNIFDLNSGKKGGILSKSLYFSSPSTICKNNMVKNKVKKIKENLN